MRRLRRALAAAAAVVSMALAPHAGAQQVDAATRATARQLGTEGMKLFEAGDFAHALEKFELADRLLPVPTLGVRAARCLVKLGRLVEASERYLEVTRITLDRTALPVQRRAQADALAEREALLPKIPTLVVAARLEPGVELRVDDKPYPPDLVGEKRPIDPGEHEVTLRRGDDVVRRRVAIALGESARVELALPARASAAPAPPPEPPTTWRTVGWVGVGVGATGVVLGVVNGLLAVSKQSDLEARCPDRNCPPEAWGDADFYDVLRGASTAGFIAGAVGLAVGVPLLLLAPDQVGTGRGGIGAHLAWGRAGVGARF